jgi:hypothetical protein
MKRKRLDESDDLFWIRKVQELARGDPTLPPACGYLVRRVPYGDWEKIEVVRLHWAQKDAASKRWGSQSDRNPLASGPIRSPHRREAKSMGVPQGRAPWQS